MRKAWDKHGMKTFEVREEPTCGFLQDVRSPGAARDEGRAFAWVASLTDEQLEAAIAAVREIIEAREKASTMAS